MTRSTTAGGMTSTLTVAVPPDSSIVESAVAKVTVEGSSSSSMVIVKELIGPRLAPLGETRMNSSVSAPSTSRSSRIGTVRTTDVVSAGKTIGIGGIRKSLPIEAVPIGARATIASWAEGPERTTSRSIEPTVSRTVVDAVRN